MGLDNAAWIRGSHVRQCNAANQDRGSSLPARRESHGVQRQPRRPSGSEGQAGDDQ